MTMMLGRTAPIARAGGFVPVWVPRGDDGRPFTAGARYTTGQFWHRGPVNDNAAFKASMGLAFNRTSSKGYRARSGAYAVATANVEAFDSTYGGAPRGLSMDGARTNISTFSNTFTDVQWGKDNVAVVAEAGTEWFQVRDTTGVSLAHRLLRGNADTVTVGAPWTRSYFLRKAGRRYVYDRMTLDGTSKSVGFDLDTGTITWVSALLAARLSIVVPTLDTFLVEVIFTPTTASMMWTGPGSASAAIVNDVIQPVVGNGDITMGFDIRDAQTEALHLRSSTMRTGSGSFVRTQDFLANVSAGGLPFPGFDPTRGVLLWQGETAHAPGGPSEVLFSFDDNTSNNRIELALSSAGQLSLVIVAAGVVQAAFTTGVIPRNTVFRVAAGWGPDPANPGGPSIAKFHLNGAQVGVTDTNVIIPTVTRFRLGSGGAGGSPMFGWIAEWWHHAATAWNRLAALSVAGAV